MALPVSLCRPWMITARCILPALAFFFAVTGPVVSQAREVEAVANGARSGALHRVLPSLPTVADDMRGQEYFPAGSAAGLVQSQGTGVSLQYAPPSDSAVLRERLVVQPVPSPNVGEQVRNGRRGASNQARFLNRGRGMSGQDCLALLEEFKRLAAGDKSLLNVQTRLRDSIAGLMEQNRELTEKIRRLRAARTVSAPPLFPEIVDPLSRSELAQEMVYRLPPAFTNY